MNKINPCLWFDTQGEDATKFYTSLFDNSKIGTIARYGESGSKASGQKIGTVMTVEFEIEGQKILALNGGPIFKFTPALSFFVWRKNEKDLEDLWAQLSKGGNIRMGLDKYPWSKKYGWTSDKYGVEWQVMLSDDKDSFAPAFLFVDALFGRGEEAVKYYTSVFKNSKIETMNRDEANKTIMHCQFSLAGNKFVLMEGQGQHGYTFSEAFSLIVNCDTQEEIDYYWDTLCKGGSPSQCGWLKDKFGVSWQITPSIMSSLNADPKKSEKVMREVMKMTKLDIKKLRQAAE